MKIDWCSLAEATKVYRDRGYHDIETPWLVSEDAYYATTPPNKACFELFSAPMMGCCGATQASYGFLVASAEQGFIQLILDEKLTPVSLYQSTSACFRDDEVDDLHQRHFMKIELCRYLGRKTPSDQNIQEHLMVMMLDAEHGMLEVYQDEQIELLLESTGPLSWDIKLNGIEVGSYGYRTYAGHHWIFGTGLALPRFSIALENTAWNK